MSRVSLTHRYVSTPGSRRWQRAARNLNIIFIASSRRRNVVQLSGWLQLSRRSQKLLAFLQRIMGPWNAGVSEPRQEAPFG